MCHLCIQAPLRWQEGDIAAPSCCDKNSQTRCARSWLRTAWRPSNCVRYSLFWFQLPPKNPRSFPTSRRQKLDELPALFQEWSAPARVVHSLLWAAPALHLLQLPRPGCAFIDAPVCRSAMRRRCRAIALTVNVAALLRRRGEIHNTSLNAGLVTYSADEGRYIRRALLTVKLA